MQSSWMQSAQPCGARLLQRFPTSSEHLHCLGRECGTRARSPDGVSCDQASVLVGNGAYFVVLLITFPVALLQGASYKAILQLSAVFMLTELVTPYAPWAFLVCSSHPIASLVIITLLSTGLAKYAGLTKTIWELRIPQADNPVLWEAVLMLFLVRCTLPWATANVSLLVGVIMVRWGYIFSARAWRWSRRMRATTTQTE